MAEPTSSGILGTAAIAGKHIGIPVFFATLSAALLYLLVVPKTPKEWAQRLIVTFVGSLFLGPILFFWFASTDIGHAIVATAIEQMAGTKLLFITVDAAFVKLFLCGPFFMFGGLPSWYVLGWLVRFLEKRQGKDLMEVAQEIGRANKRFLP